MQTNFEKYNVAQDEMDYLKSWDATLSDNENRQEYESNYINLYSHLNKIFKTNKNIQPIITITAHS